MTAAVIIYMNRMMAKGTMLKSDLMISFPATSFGAITWRTSIFPAINNRNVAVITAEAVTIFGTVKADAHIEKRFCRVNRAPWPGRSPVCSLRPGRSCRGGGTGLVSLSLISFSSEKIFLKNEIPSLDSLSCTVMLLSLAASFITGNSISKVFEQRSQVRLYLVC